MNKQVMRWQDVPAEEIYYHPATVDARRTGCVLCTTSYDQNLYGFSLGRNVAVVLLLIGLLLGSGAISPIRAQDESVVHAIMFWMEGCGHCDWVKSEVLSPLSEQYGDQWQLALIELSSAEDFDHLFALGASLGVPEEAVGVPFLLIGDAVLIGSEQIQAKLPDLIEQYLTAGGVGWPAYPALAELLPEDPMLPGNATASVSSVPPNGAIVHAILFSTPGCYDCRLITAQALVPLREQYGAVLDVQNVDIVTSEDVTYLYQIAAGYNLSQEQVDLPMLIIGEHVLIGEQIPAALPGLVEQYLNADGITAPVLPVQSEAAPSPVNVAPSRPTHSNGFSLAVIVLIGMIIALVFAIARFIRALTGSCRPRSSQSEVDRFIPLLAALGLAVAAYLAYVETQAVAAVCGPVGDCNAVQTSEYAYLFGIPIGVLGVIGYIAILLVWGWGRWQADPRAPLALFGMTSIGVLFSTYLTYLEPFVIGAVCIWCLTSAVIMTLLLMASVEPAARQLVPAWRRHRNYR